MSTEILVLFAGGTFAGPTDVTCFDFLWTEEPVANGTLEHGAADILDLFGSVGSFPVGGTMHVKIGQTLLRKEFAMASRTSVRGLLSTTLVIITTLGLTTSATFLPLRG